MSAPRTHSTMPKCHVAVLSVSDDFWDFMVDSLSDLAHLTRISTPQQLDEAVGAGINFDFAFVPHWRWLLPPTVLGTWSCIGFHTSALPVGRGGSPIQNQIVRGIYNSELCAIQISDQMDAGDVLMRESVDLSEGSFAEIMASLALKAGAMSRRILLEMPEAVPQEGEPSVFKRRRPEESEIPGSSLSVRQIYDRIRMVDGLDYPRAFIDFGPWRLTFTNAEIMEDSVQATVTWTRRDEAGTDV